MQVSVLQLNRLFIESLGFATQKDYEPKDPSIPLGSIDPKDLVVSIFNAPERPIREPVIRLSVELPDVAVNTEGNDTLSDQAELAGLVVGPIRAKYPYKFHIVVLGSLRVADQVPDSDIQKLVCINGPALLYGAAREALLSATGRGPWRPLLLPSVHFADNYTPPARIPQVEDDEEKSQQP